MDRLNPTVLRGVDLKIQFDSLRPNQTGKPFTRVLAEQRGYTRSRRVAESVKTRLSKLSTLTPEDFAIVVRQARALGTRYNSERLMAALEEEHRAKQCGMKSVIGFVS